MFGTTFTIADTHLKHLRGQESLKTFSQSRTVASGYQVTNHFCGTCGSLMYRVSEQYPGWSVLRLGTVDDFQLHETKLKPQEEHFASNRVAWLKPVDGTKQVIPGRL